MTAVYGWGSGGFEKLGLTGPRSYSYVKLAFASEPTLLSIMLGSPKGKHASLTQPLCPNLSSILLTVQMCSLIWPCVTFYMTSKSRNFNKWKQECDVPCWLQEISLIPKSIYFKISSLPPHSQVFLRKLTPSSDPVGLEESKESSGQKANPCQGSVWKKKVAKIRPVNHRRKSFQAWEVVLSYWHKRCKGKPLSATSYYCLQVICYSRLWSQEETNYRMKPKAEIVEYRLSGKYSSDLTGYPTPPFFFIMRNSTLPFDW